MKQASNSCCEQKETKKLFKSRSWVLAPVLTHLRARIIKVFLVLFVHKKNFSLCLPLHAVQP